MALHSPHSPWRSSRLTPLPPPSAFAAAATTYKTLLSGVLTMDDAEEGSADPPLPRSPPGYPDLCGRHRLQAQVQVLSREIGFLEEELQSVEGLQPVSVYCKEVDEYVGTTPDPLIPLYEKPHKRCRFWRWLRGGSSVSRAMVCCNATSTSCCSGSCSNWQKRRPSCTCRPSCSCPPGSGSRHRSCCCCRVSCTRLHCVIPTISCPGYSCGCVCSCSNCTKVRLCPRCLCCFSHCVCE